MKVTSGRVLLVMLSCIVVGIIFMWWSTALPVPWNALVSTLGAVVMTVGLVNGLSDLFLRQSVARDLMSYMASDRRLVESGLDGLMPAAKVEWSALIRQATVVSCYVNDPSSFRSLIWPHIVESAGEKPQSIELYFLDPASSHLQVVADRMGSEAEFYRQGVISTLQDVEDDWKTAKRHKKSNLVLRTADDPARYGYVRCDDRYALFLDQLARKAGPHNVLLIRSDRSTYPSAQWLEESINAFQRTAKAPQYSDRPDESSNLMTEE